MRKTREDIFDHCDTRCFVSRWSASFLDL